MELEHSVQLLARQAALVVDYGFAVGVIAVVIACASLYFRARIGEHLRQTGERHDRIQMQKYNPAHKVIVQRPEELDPKEPSGSRSAKADRPRHRWRSRR